MTFLEAMQWVEMEHGFPEGAQHYHPRRAAWVLERSGLAEQVAKIPCAVIAGSCGKASTARFLAYILQASGATVGLGTKPPLHETLDGNRERYQMFRPADERPRWIEPDVFALLFDRLQPLFVQAEREFGVLAAYDMRLCLLAAMFVELGVDFGIVEANIGLRQDVSRAWPTPRVVGLTPIGTDHAALLQPTTPLPAALETLGDAAGPTWHKAGDVWPGIPIVLGRQTPEVAAAIAVLAPRAYRDWHLYDRQISLAHNNATLKWAGLQAALTLRAVGRFHLDNASHAASISRHLLDPTRPSFIDAVQRGTSNCDTPGRMQRIADSPVTLANVAMSHTKVTATLQAATDLLDDTDGRLIVVAHFLDRVHKVRECAADIARHPRVAAFFSTAWHADPRAPNVPSSTLADWARSANAGQHVEAVEPPAAAVARACSVAGPEGVVVLIGDGSWF